MKKNDPIEEARRYVDNARQTLKENGEYDRSTQTYADDKYVRSAGHFLWNAVLIVLDAVFGVKTKTRPHPDTSRTTRKPSASATASCSPW